MHNNTPSYTVDEATKKLEHFCAYQERCHKEVVQKLRDMRMIPEAIDQIVVHLLQENFLNEERFARAYARGKFRIKKWGRYRIKSELKQRQISAYLIKMAMTEIEEDVYLETFYELVEKKYSQLTGTTQNKKSKLVRYLQYRGWESGLVYEAVNDIARKNP